MAKRKPTDTVQVPARMRESLRAQLEKDAKAAKRSLNAEIIDRLNRSYRLDARIAELEMRLSEQELATTVLESAKDVLRRVEAAGFSAGTATVSGVGEDAAASRAVPGLLSTDTGDDNG